LIGWKNETIDMKLICKWDNDRYANGCHADRNPIPINQAIITYLPLEPGNLCLAIRQGSIQLPQLRVELGDSGGVPSRHILKLNNLQIKNIEANPMDPKY
jgi:hypothetical protein